MAFAGQNTEYLDVIIALMPGHVYWKDRSGILLGCNDNQAKSLGLKKREDIIGLTAFDTLPEKLARDVTNNDKMVMDAGEQITAEEIYEDETGKQAFWLSQKTPIFHEGKVIGLVGISINITAEKELAQAKMEKAALTKQLNSQAILSAAIAHEMRTPFATLTASSQSLKRLLPKLVNLVEKAEAAGIESGIRQADLEALTEIPDEQTHTIAAANNFINLLLRSFEESNPKKLEILSIEDCVTDALRHYPQPQLKLIDIHTTLEPIFTFQGDANTFQHVLFNLLKNAIHYVQKAQKGDIQIWTELGKRYNILHFKDTGTGIAAEDLPKIFDHFFSKSRHGTGIGLAFAQLAIEKIGGHIECDSVEGEYTHFKILLPLEWHP